MMLAFNLLTVGADIVVLCVPTRFTHAPELDDRDDGAAAFPRYASAAEGSMYLSFNSLPLGVLRSLVCGSLATRHPCKFVCSVS